jgi:photosystem II stability/assembly factor-like uncharacterized protein
MKLIVLALAAVPLGACIVPLNSNNLGSGSGSGSSSGSGFTLPPLPPAQSCAGKALPAPGMWDAKSIAPVAPDNPNLGYSFSGKSTAVVVDPFDAATVWLGTGDKGLFKSTDCGFSWTKVNTGTGGAEIDQSVLWSMAVDPKNKGVIYTVAAYGANGLWKSTNDGVDWVQLLPSSTTYAQVAPMNFVGNVSMDAGNSMHLAIASHGPCSPPYSKGCIAESTDGGATWPSVVEMPVAWGEHSGVQIINATTLIWGSGGMGLYLTQDNGKTWKQVLPAGGGDGFGQESILPLKPAVDGAYYAASNQGVVRSTDGIAWSLAWDRQNGTTPGITGIAVSGTTIYGSNNTAYFAAAIGAYGSWGQISPPPALTSNGNADFLAYDETHRLLYSSTWAGGLYRAVLP